MLFKLLLPLSFLYLILGQKNNACRKWSGYWTADFNEDCFYFEDMHLNPEQLMMKHTGVAQTHYVTSDDAYIITVFRMPQDKPKGCIVLYHPLLADGRVYIGQGEESFAFYLWNLGYDVWVANSRGTRYSQNHTTLSANDYDFWKFSLHEIGYYELSSVVKYINEVCEEKVIVISHSLGAVANLIYGSLKPEEAENLVKVFVSMSTPAYTKYSTSPTNLLVPFEPILQRLFRILQIGSVLGNFPVEQFIRVVSRAFPGALRLIDLLFSAVFGWTPDADDPAIINFDFGVFLQTFSWNCLFHGFQLQRTRTRFQQFDYGPEKNFGKYGSVQPPVYPLPDIRNYICFVSSPQDIVFTLKDTDLLIKEQLKANQTCHLKVPEINHLGYQWSRNKPQKYYETVVRCIEGTCDNPV